MATLKLTGASGQTYIFTVLELDAVHAQVACVYYVSKRTVENGKGTHAKVYIGQTGNLFERMQNHHEEMCFIQHDANAISVLEIADEESRLAIEADLIDVYNPPCNG